MKRRIQIRRDAADPVAVALEEGRKLGRADQKKDESRIVAAAVATALAGEQVRHNKDMDNARQEINHLNQRLVEVRNEVERLQRSGARIDPTQEKIRKRLQTDDTKDWIAQFGDGDEPFIEDEAEYGRSPASPTTGRPRFRR